MSADVSRAPPLAAAAVHELRIENPAFLTDLALTRKDIRFTASDGVCWQSCLPMRRAMSMMDFFPESPLPIALGLSMRPVKAAATLLRLIYLHAIVAGLISVWGLIWVHPKRMKMVMESVTTLSI
ncbi:MAG: hypothetical protein WC340_10065 [Kiritimatiellia bacterium]